MVANWHILVVEDDPDGQEVVAQILEHLNISYQLANDGEQAEALVNSNQFNAIIIDLALPGMDGWELLDAVRQLGNYQSVPCIAITAYHTSKTREDALNRGFDGYFAKPLDAMAFARGLEDIINNFI